MRARGQALIALAAFAVLLATGVALDDLGPRAPQPGPAKGGAPSGAWFCPHGGGADQEWQVTLSIANPGTEPVDVRVTDLGAKKTSAPRAFTVAPGSTLAVPANGAGRETSSYVEWFGGWVGVGWVAQAGGAETGVAAEPCSPTAASRQWYAADGDTEQGQDAYLVVMNPFDIEAVFDVALLTATRAPIRHSDLSDYVLKPHRSVAFHLNRYANGEVAVGAQVDVAIGRVAVASLGTADSGGIRSVLGVTAPSRTTTMLAAGDAGQSVLVAMTPLETQARFSATLLSADDPEPAGGLTGAAQAATSAKTYPVITSGASAVDLRAAEGSPALVATRRVQGVSADVGGTGGAVSAASAWVVMPTVVGSPSAPGLVLANTASESVDVTLRLLPTEGQTVSTPTTTITVPAASVIEVPSDFLTQAPDAAVLATSSAGTFIATGASASLGGLGTAGFAIASGIVVPA
jgi:hypothetical protein